MNVFRLKPIPLLFLAAASLARAETLVEPGDRIAICGDSITEQKRYSVMMETYLLACQPAALRPDDIAQFGWGGERIGGLLARLGTDVTWFRPTVATLCYGMNDGSYAAPTVSSENIYRKNLTATVKQLKKLGATRIVVGSSSPVDFTGFLKADITAAGYNETLARLAAVGRDVAAKEHETYADLLTPMLAVMKSAKAQYGQDYRFTIGDGVHPVANGHIIMAYAFLKALGCDGQIGTIAWDAAAGRATASAGHRVIAVNDHELTLESTRYPYCISGDPAAPDSARRTIGLFPFNEDLNRLILRVTGLSAQRVRITWGAAAKEFAAADLERGINLAAEFSDNPFSAPFAAIEQAVVKQQALETPLVKGVLHESATIGAAAPQSYAAFVADLESQRQRQYEGTKAAVIPVRSTLKINSVLGT